MNKNKTKNEKIETTTNIKFNKIQRNKIIATRCAQKLQKKKEEHERQTPLETKRGLLQRQLE